MRLNGLFAFVAAASHAAERCCLEDSAIRWRSYNRGRRKRHESYPCLRVPVTTLLSGYFLIQRSYMYWMSTAY